MEELCHRGHDKHEENMSNPFCYNIDRANTFIRVENELLLLKQKFHGGKKKINQYYEIHRITKGNTLDPLKVSKDGKSSTKQRFLVEDSDYSFKRMR